MKSCTLFRAALAAVVSSISPALAGTTQLSSTASITPISKESYGGPILTRDHLTGNWFGLRDTLAAHGFKFDLEWTQFYQGLAEGTPDDDFNYAGHADAFVHIDGQKAGLWPGLFVTVHGEYRYGDASIQGGVLSPVNTMMISPAGDGNVFAVTNLTVTQAFSESVMLTLGKINTLDLYEKEFLGGRGTEGFMNINLVGPLIGARTVPLSTLGAVLSILHKGKPLFNIGVLDARSPTTQDGFNGLAADELTVMADLSFYTKINGLDGIHNISGTWSSIDAVSLDSSDYLRPPTAAVPIPTQRSDSWQVSYLYEQYLGQDRDDPQKGWGVFGLVGISDGNPNPVQWAASAGLYSKGIGALRPDDRAGVGLFYVGVSDDLRDTLSPLVPIGDEYGGEVFYDCAVTKWFRVAVDLQVIRPVVAGNDTAIYAGIRGRIIF